MNREQRAEWQSLKRNETIHQSHIDQWWREFEQHKDALDALIELMPKTGSVLRCALMLISLQLSVNMLSRTLDEIE